MHFRTLTRRRFHDLRKLCGQKSPHHGNYTIVPADWMESKGKRSKPEAGGSYAAAAEVADHYALSCHTIHLRGEFDCLIGLEVMKDLRSHRDIDAVVGERQCECVSSHDSIHRSLLKGDKGWRRVDSNCPERYSH